MLKVDGIDGLIQDLLGRVELTTEELSYLKQRAPNAFVDASHRAEAKAQHLERERTRAQRDLAYLTENRITLLREGVYSAAEYSAEVRRLERDMARIETNMHEEAVPAYGEMVDVITNFSELVRLAGLSYKRASAYWRHEIATSAITELVVMDGEFANVTAKDGFRALAKRWDTPSCAPTRSRT